MRKSSADIGAGLGFLLIGVAFGVQYGELEGVSRVFPEALISFITLGALYFIIKGCWRRRSEVEEHSETEAVAWKRIGIISVMAIAYLVVLSYIGFFVATFAFLLTSYLILGDHDAHGWGRVIGYGVLFAGLFSVVIWLGFVKLLNVPTPEGFLF